ncbi:MAG: hypothetical protein HZB91_04750 [Elusimicrobia bacterium]|nr:hypothetical protein [Elusimicrobiota bacterium]
MDIKTLAGRLRAQRLFLFSPDDVGLLFPGEIRSTRLLQLHQWAKKGWVRRLKRGLYELAYPEHAALPDLHIANRLYEPSYVSLDTALSHYQIIPETAAQVTSVTTKATRRLRNFHGLFSYFTVRPAAFIGYGVVHWQGCSVKLAEPEKALVDRLYAALRRGERLNIPEDRWDIGRIRKMKRRRLMDYAEAFGRAGLKERIHALLR